MLVLLVMMKLNMNCKTTSNDSSVWADLLSDGYCFDVGSKVKPQREEARQGLENVAVAILHSQAIVAHHFRQDLQVGLILPQGNPASGQPASFWL